MATPFAAAGPGRDGQDDRAVRDHTPRCRGTDALLPGADAQGKNNLKLKIPATVPCSTIHSFVKRKPAALPPTFVIDEGSMVDLSCCRVRDDRDARLRALVVVIAGDVGQPRARRPRECFRRAVDQLGRRASSRLGQVLRIAARDAVRGAGVNPQWRARARVVDADAGVRQGGVEVRRPRERTAATCVQYIAWQNAHCSTINGIDAAEGAGQGRCAWPSREGRPVVYVGANKPNDGMTNAMMDRGASTTRNMRSASVFWEDGVARTVRADDPQLAYCITAQGASFADVCVVALALEHEAVTRPALLHTAGIAGPGPPASWRRRTGRHRRDADQEADHGLALA
jgi:hypothetical protein